MMPKAKALSGISEETDGGGDEGDGGEDDGEEDFEAEAYVAPFLLAN
jgi:hypothetical protein